MYGRHKFIIVKQEWLVL